LGEGAHRNGDIIYSDFSTAPDETEVDAIAAHAVDHDLVEQAAQQGFLLGAGQDRGGPELRELLAQGSQRLAKFGREGIWTRRGLSALLGGLLGLPQVPQCSLPASLELR